MSTTVKEEATVLVMAVLGFPVGGPGGALVAIAGIRPLISRYAINAS